MSQNVVAPRLQLQGQGTSQAPAADADKLAGIRLRLAAFDKPQQQQLQNLLGFLDCSDDFDKPLMRQQLNTIRGWADDLTERQQRNDVFLLIAAAEPKLK